jgi:hypothetical protein
MLRKLRVVLAVLFMISITAMFLDFTGTLSTYLGWMAKVQLLPAVMALNVVAVVALVVLTLLFGRIYCSVICPMGVFQDVVSHLSSLRKGKKKRFKYTPARNWLRYTVLVLFVLAIVAGFTAIASIIAPYSAYGRMVRSLVYVREVWVLSLPVVIVAAATFVVIVVMSWRGGRDYCNTVCPVGSLLGLISRYSYLRPVINTDKCINCGSCGRRCKASCIDTKNHTIDLSRCVACMDCIENCSTDAISFTRRPLRVKSAGHGASAYAAAESAGTADSGRRNFIIAGAVAAGSAVSSRAQKITDGGLAVLEDKKMPERVTRLVPPGAVSLGNMAQHCTACQLCVSQCPEGVLRASTEIDTFMQPYMDFDHGYCRPECTKCSEVCPSGAIRPITWEEKSAIQIGRAVWVPANCIVNTDGVECGNCARHCLVGAIKMVPSEPDNPESRKIPAVDESRYIGCGACETVCPARPFSAIYVEGLEVHREV